MRGRGIGSLALVVLGGVAMIVQAGEPATAGKDAVLDHVLPPDTGIPGRSVAELTADWWRWVRAQPFSPYLDPDGRLCDLGQEGAVWFLAGTDGSFNARRECNVPTGKYLLLPVINMLHRNVQPVGEPDTYSCPELVAGAAVNNDHLNSAVVLIDGVPVPEVARYRVRTAECFDIDADIGEHRAADGDGRMAAADGYWLLIEPLPPGRHTIHVGANYGASDRGYGAMVQNFEYVLDVGGWVNTAMLAPPGSGIGAGRVASKRP